MPPETTVGNVEPSRSRHPERVGTRHRQEIAICGQPMCTRDSDVHLERRSPAQMRIVPPISLRYGIETIMEIPKMQSLVLTGT